MHNTVCRKSTERNNTPTRSSLTIRQSKAHQSTLVKQQICTINILSINVCGIKSKLLVKEFNELLMTYNVICMCEIECNDVDKGNLREKMGVKDRYYI